MSENDQLTIGNPSSVRNGGDEAPLANQREPLVRGRVDPSFDTLVEPIPVGVVGLGTIGARVAEHLQHRSGALRLAAISSLDVASAGRRAGQLGLSCSIVSVADLIDQCRIVVDCAVSGSFDSIARPAVERGRTVVTVNGAALLDNLDLVDLARANGGRIILASGALLGFDALRAAAIETIHSVRLTTRKPPEAFAGAPRVIEMGIDLAGLSAPTLLFQGNALEAARAFPANVNVVAALALAGIGPERTMADVWADPALSRNTHQIETDSDSSRFSMKIENIPSDTNPATGRLSALSVIAALERIVSPLVVGS